MPDPATDALLAQARKLLGRFPVIDGHNDLAWALREVAEPAGPARRAGAARNGAPADAAWCAVADTDISEQLDFTHTDLPRLAAGGVGAQFWSVYVPGELQGDAAVATTLEQIDLVRRLIARHRDRLELAQTAGDMQRIMDSGRIASMLGAEGGHSIGCSLGVLRAFYDLGVRYLTLTHNLNVPWADSATDEPAAGGLTDFGRKVVREMQRLGMLVDLSHTSAATMADALDAARAPVIFSHSSARALCDHPRNVPDEILAVLAANGGVCMATFVPAFVSERCRAWAAEAAAEMGRRGLDHRTLARRRLMDDWVAANPPPAASVADVADHIEHIRAVAGIEHVGIGGDFDGTTELPSGLADVSCYPALFAELLRRGWSEADCGKLSGGNILRVLGQAEAASSRG